MNDQELQMNEVDKKMLKKAINFEDKGDFAMYEEVSEIKDHLEGIHENLKMMAEKPEMEMPEVHKVSIEGAEVITIKGKDGVDPTDEHLIELITPLIPKPIKGDDGKTPTTQELIKIIRPLIPEPEKGDDGNTPTEEELKKLITPLIPQPLQGSPDTYSQIIDKLESIDNESEKLKIDAIQDLREELEKIKKSSGRLPTGGFNYKSVSSHFIDDQTPTGTINGSNTAFTIANIPNPASSLKVYLNGQRMRITEDYTFSGVTITFTNAPLTGSVLLTDYRI